MFKTTARLVVLLFCLCLSIYSTVPPVRAADNADKDKSALVSGWQLDQVNRSAGAIKVFITDKHLKIIQLNSSRELVSSAPDWTFYSIDHHAHSYNKSKSDSSTNLLMQRVMVMMGGDLSKVKWHAIERATACGTTIEHLADSAYDRQKSKAAATPDEFTDELKVKGFWVIKDFPIAAKAANQLAHWHGLPEVGKVPFAFVHFSTAGHPSTILQTMSIKQMRFKASLFDPPVGYKESKNDIDIDTKRRKSPFDERQ